MKRYCAILLVSTLMCGCRSVSPEFDSNPFDEFSASDVSRISLCFEASIAGPEHSDPKDGSPADPVITVEFYLEPSGVAIRDRATIGRLHKAMTETPFSSTNAIPGIGVLGYQVFFGKQNQILAVTQIINYRSMVVLTRCRMHEGRIQFIHNRSIPMSGRNDSFCRMIYGFMKQELPEVIATQDQHYKNMKNDLSLETLLFKD